MRRRRALKLGGGILSTLFAGCATGQGGERTATVPDVTASTETRSMASTPTPPETTAASTASSTGTPVRSYRDAFASFLDGNDVTVTELRADSPEPIVELRYVSTKSGYQEIGAQIGMISGGYFRQVARGWERERLNSTILNPEEAPVATWHAKTAWFRDFQNEEITAEKLSFRILDTLEPVEDSGS